MKKKIIKLWGVGMIVVLMASLLIVGATPAAAGTLAYTGVGLPNPPLSNQIAASDVDIIKVAPNGDIFVVDRQAAPNRVLKSVDGGKTWTAAAPNATIAATNIADLAISPSYAIDSTVFILVNSAGPPIATYTLRSTNGGASFLQYGSAIGGGGTEVGTSLAVEPDYVSGAGQVMVGTADTAIANFGDVYIWTDVAFAWLSQDPTAVLADDFTSVAFSTNYGTDRCILALGTSAGGLQLHTKIHTNVFDFAPQGAVVIDAAITEMGVLPATDIVSSAIALPGDFNAGFESTKNIFVGYTSGAGATDGVYRITYSPAPAPYTVVGPTNLGLLAPANPSINNLAINGNYNAGTLSLYAGLVGSPVVYRTTSGNTPAGPFVWAAPITPATGAGGNGYVALDPGFVTNTTVYNGTATGGALDESAVSVSVDGGAHYYQTGLIDTPVLGAAVGLSYITDFVPYSATEWYLVTATTASLESLWKTTDGGVTWVRILAVATVTDTAAIRLSQDYGADSVMYFTETGSPGVAPILMRSTDGGATWTLRFYPAALSAGPSGVGDLLVIDQFILYVGDVGAGTVYTSPNSGSFWDAQAMVGGATGVNQIAYHAGTGHMLAGTINGMIYRNTGTAWANVTLVVGAATNTFVAFGSTYDGVDDTTHYVGAVGVAGTYVATVGVPVAPQIDAAAPVTTAAGIVCAPDGTVYAADAAANGGIMRVLPGPGAAAEKVAAGDGLLPAGATLASLAYLPGSNVLYAIENSGLTASTADQILTYTDTLTTAVPTVISPAEGDVLLAATAAVTIEPIAGIPPVPGPAYFVQWNTRPDWLGIGNVIPIPNVINTVNLNDAGGLGVPGNIPIPAGTVIYLRVQNRTPVLGPWSATISISTELVPLAPNAPGIIPIAGGNGNTGPGGFNTPLTPTFSWGTVGLATGYEFRLATDPGMTDVIKDLTGPDALGNVSTYALADITLEYGTTYYWQVRGVSATSNTAWSPITSFTTMQEPVEPPPPVTVTDVPPPEITVTVDIPPAPPATTITQPPQVVEKISEGYIWAIIIIGAVLVIAVIVLVVRTRRSV